MVSHEHQFKVFRKFFSWWPYFALGTGTLSIVIGFSLVVVSAQTQATGVETAAVVCEPPDLLEIAIDVAGGVEHPGVYRLPVGSLVGDALQAAGGLGEQADLVTVAKQLNLAAELEANAKLYVPLKGEVEESAGNTASATKKLGLISVNTATEKELESLPGIGEKRAAEIVAERPYTSLDELVERGVLSKSLLSELESQLTL